MKLSPGDDDRLWKEPKKTSWFCLPSPLRYVVFLILLVILLVGLWYLIYPTRQWYDKKDLTLIQADQQPYKIKAENQGVPSIKHQDKLVYGRIRADQSEAVAEHILPDPEAPVLQIKEQGDTIKMVEEYLPEDVDPEKIGELIEPKPEGDIASLILIEDLIEESSEEKQEEEKKSLSSNRNIQLGSHKSTELAESEWIRLSRKHPNILGEFKPVIQKIDLGKEQGVYYRLQTGPFNEPGKADEACRILKEQKVDCVVIP